MSVAFNLEVMTLRQEGAGLPSTMLNEKELLPRHTKTEIFQALNKRIAFQRKRTWDLPVGAMALTAEKRVVKVASDLSLRDLASAGSSSEATLFSESSN